jgi:hypothetical protein
MIEWSLGVGEFVKKLCGRVKLGIVLIKRRMDANVVLIYQHVCQKTSHETTTHLCLQNISNETTGYVLIGFSFFLWHHF